jgi:hypothetical protein
MQSTYVPRELCTACLSTVSPIASAALEFKVTAPVLHCELRGTGSNCWVAVLLLGPLECRALHLEAGPRVPCDMQLCCSREQWSTCWQPRHLADRSCGIVYAQAERAAAMQ